MTQVAERKMTYPKGRMVVVRDCTVAICCNHNSGATLLSTLLFWYDHPQKYDTYNDEEHTFTVCRTQAEIEEAACHQIDAKTIHDSAVPLLHLFGYTSVSEKMNGNLYTIHMDQVFAAYAAYEQGAKATRTFLKSQLEKTLIDVSPAQLEEMLIKKRKLSLQLEKTLIQIRENSHCKRGRKTKPKEAAEEVSEKDRIFKNFKDSNKRDSLVASASAESDGGISFLSSLSQFEETLKDVQNGQTPLQASVAHRREEESVKEADTSKTPATSAVNDTTPDEEALQEIPTQVALLPAIPVTPMKPASPTKTDEKGNSKLSGKKDTRSPEERTRCQKWQAFFNARRGGEPLALKGPRINESECIISLVQKFTDEQIIAIDTFVLAEIFPHKLPANKHKVGARIVLDESQNAREVLKDRFKWPPSGTSSGNMPSLQSGPKPDKYILHMRKLTQVSHASQAILEGREMPPLVGEYFTAQDHEDYRKRVLDMVEDGRACYEKEKVAL